MAGLQRDLSPAAGALRSVPRGDTSPIRAVPRLLDLTAAPVPPGVGGVGRHLSFSVSGAMGGVNPMAVRTCVSSGYRHCRVQVSVLQAAGGQRSEMSTVGHLHDTSEVLV